MSAPKLAEAMAAWRDLEPQARQSLFDEVLTPLGCSNKMVGESTRERALALLIAATEPEAKACYCDAPEWQASCPVHGKAEPEAKATWRCSCKRDKTHDTIEMWDPMCELHGAAVGS